MTGSDMPPMPQEDPLAREQARQNRGTAGQWQLYAPHRAQVEKLLLSARADLAATPVSLCVLGAGNCNDLDLNHLARLFERVRLVDIDPQALADGLRRQAATHLRQISTQAPVDLSGLGPMLSAWHGLPPVPSAIEQAVDWVGRHQPFGNEPCAADVVLSPCLLSQLIEPVRLALGAKHEKYPLLRKAIVARHLRLLSELVKPGGKGLLVIDLACSDYVPDLGRTQEQDVLGLMNGLLERGKYFSGLAPHELLAVLRADATLSEVRPHRPWIWHLSLKRSFIVYAISFHKRDL